MPKNGFRYLDTIYTVNKFIPLFLQYAKQNNIQTKIEKEVIVALDNGGDYNQYPYMDTFIYYTPDLNILSNKYGLYKIKNRDGSYKEGNITSNDELFIKACEVGNIYLVKKLLNNDKIDPTIKNNLPFIVASMDGRYEVVKILLQDDRIDPTSKDNLAISIAYKERNYKVVELLAKDERIINKAKQDNDIEVLDIIKKYSN